MIIDQSQLDQKLPLDAPPSYDTLVSFDPSAYRDEKSTYRPLSSTSSDPSLSPTSSRTPTSPASSTYHGYGSGALSPKGKAKAVNWFNFTATRTSREVRNTVLGLVRDLVREHHADSAAPAGILSSCAGACAAYDLAISDILQEKSIENHTPLYWAIVKRKPDELQDEGTQIPDLIIALLSYSTPLKPASVADIRLACLVTSDQRLFQRLRMSSEFSTVSAADEMLLGVTQSQDEVEVTEVAADDDGSFAVDMVIPHFQKRMMVTGEIMLEFIARSRMWRIMFKVATHYQHTSVSGGSWCLIVGLQPNSPPTWLDGQLVIEEPARLDDSNPKPPIQIRLKTGHQQMDPPRLGVCSSTDVVASLQQDSIASTLQYNGTSYIAADEKLRARFEARLRKPEDPDCVIC
ncbi:hypothetical protein FA15DRAFT_617912 [Coprinopsis marcescibilis]|uniref:Uncharacterized protein n=1 Tax=Coprinopsis marcescibilis TaxID=230819 RepID=A0A5C3KY59_COPMA|nr:hypothetical protein FA15DRAFT_617912 [Coprinopsis marcescibilis]